MPGAPGQCGSQTPCQFTAGTYQTYGRWAFLPGLTMYIPDGWNSTEQDAGEFNLFNPDFPDGNGLFFWRDVIPVEPDGTHIMTVPSTVAGITSWLSANHRLRVSDPMKVVIGKGLDTTTMVVDVPDATVNKDHGMRLLPEGGLLRHPHGSSALGRGLDGRVDREQPLLPRRHRPGFEPPPPGGGTRCPGGPRR